MTTTEVREHPILFQGEMVRAILDGRKTQTRRVIRQQPEQVTADGAFWYSKRNDFWRNTEQFARDCCPYGVPGDLLWVRETWAVENHYDEVIPRYLPVSLRVYYRAEHQSDDEFWSQEQIGKVRPSIHIPRWASRITLEVLSVRVERVQAISADDADAEIFGGDIPSDVLPDLFPGDWGHLSIPECFAILWDSGNGKKPGCAWASNPWVWVVEFKEATR